MGRVKGVKTPRAGLRGVLAHAPKLKSLQTAFSTVRRNATCGVRKLNRRPDLPRLQRDRIYAPHTKEPRGARRRRNNESPADLAMILDLSGLLKPARSAEKACSQHTVGGARAGQIESSGEELATHNTNRSAIRCARSYGRVKIIEAMKITGTSPPRSGVVGCGFTDRACPADALTQAATATATSVSKISSV